MLKKTISENHSKFLNDEIWILTFGGAFQRSGIYSNNISDEDKRKFRKTIKTYVTDLVKNKYPKGTYVSGEGHIENLKETKKWIDKKYGAEGLNILKEGRIKFGVVQKLVNLYLKYQWCLQQIEEPPHCPFDRIIITKMKLKNLPSWTKLEKIEKYQELVDEASKAAKEEKKSIAQWELDAFRRKN